MARWVGVVCLVIIVAACARQSVRRGGDAHRDLDLGADVGADVGHDARPDGAIPDAPALDTQVSDQSAPDSAPLSCESWQAWSCTMISGCGGTTCSARCPATSPQHGVICSSVGSCSCMDYTTPARSVLFSPMGTGCDVCWEAFHKHGCGLP